MSYPLPENELERRAVLHAYRLLDTEPEPVYDQLVQLAGQLLGAPVSAISLIDADRQWIKAQVGLPVKELPRAGTCCAYVILQDEPFCVSDLTQDSRFSGTPMWLGNQQLRSYLGAPLTLANGIILGSLFVADTRPRTFSPEETNQLVILARQVTEHIEFRLTELRLKEAQQLARLGSWEEDVLTGRLFWSDELFGLLDFDSAQGAPDQAAFIARIHPDDLEGALLVFHGMVAGNDSYAVDLRFCHRDGSVHWMHCRGKALKGTEGRTIKIIGTTMEITERKKAEEALRSSEERLLMTRQHLELALAWASLGTFQRDLRTDGYLLLSPTCRRHCGLQTEGGVVFEQVLQCVHPEDRPWVEARIEHSLRENKGYEMEVRCLHEDGTVHWLQVAASVVLDSQGKPAYISGVTQDITEQKQRSLAREQALQEAQDRADRDPLTGLLNHRAFHNRLRNEAQKVDQEGGCLTLVMLDTDNFKFFNDAYGHATGDEVLCLIAQHLQASCGFGASLARFGGDEFALLIRDRGGIRTGDWETTLREGLQELVYVPVGQSNTIPITLSLGVAVFPQQTSDLLELVRLADEQLRRAKSGDERETQADRTRARMSSQLAGFSMLDALVTAVDNKDRYTRRHSEEVLTYCLQLACHLDMPPDEQHLLAVAALLHDVGKIGVPDAILRKPGVLSPTEYAAVQQHAAMGAAIVSAVEGLEGTHAAILHHHEAWDGTGYPQGLVGESIPYLARLMAVADAFSAMTTDRPYRKGTSQAQALAILQEGAGRQWDPELVAAFVEVHRAPVA